MKKKLLELAARIDAYSLRERIAFMVVGVLILFLAYDRLLVDPLLIDAKALSSTLQQKKNELQQLRAQQAAIVKRGQVDPDADNKKIQKTLNSAIEKANQQLQASTAGLINPTTMPVVLESVLKKIEGLELQSISLLPPVSLADLLAEEKITSGKIPGVYQHGLKLTFSGTYLDTLAYLQALESLESRIYWGGADLTVTSYPDATVTLIVNTLSLNEAWIGI